MDPTIDDYADHDVIVTRKDKVRGEPTVPFGHALHVADQQAEEAINGYDGSEA